MRGRPVCWTLGISLAFTVGAHGQVPATPVRPLSGVPFATDGPQSSGPVLAPAAVPLVPPPAGATPYYPPVPLPAHQPGGPAPAKLTDPAKPAALPTVPGQPGCALPAYPPPPPFPDVPERMPTTQSACGDRYCPEMIGDYLPMSYSANVRLGSPGNALLSRQLTLAVPVSIVPAGTTTAPSGLGLFGPGVSVGGIQIVTGTPTAALITLNQNLNAPLANTLVPMRAPVIALGDIKIADNESPFPQDRAFINYNWVNNVHNSLNRGLHTGATALVLPSAGTDAILQNAVANLPSGTPLANNPDGIVVVDTSNGGLSIVNANQPFAVNGPAGVTTIGQLGNATLATVPVLLPHVKVHDATFGVEDSLYCGRISVGVRVPLLDTYNTGPTAESRDSSDSEAVDDMSIGDVTLIVKWLALTDHCGSGLSLGLAVTLPTGPDIIPAGSGRLEPAVFQPFLGYRLDFGVAFLQGFSSYLGPTREDIPQVVLNDVGVGFWLVKPNPIACPEPSNCAAESRPVVRDNAFRGMYESWSTIGIAPTLEFHATTPLNHRGAVDPVGLDDVFSLTGGLDFVFGGGSNVKFGVSAPIGGPRAYDYELIGQLNYHF